MSTETPSIKVLFFGRVSDVAGQYSCGNPKEIDLPKSVHSITDLARHIGNGKPELSAALLQDGNLFSINQRMCNTDSPVAAGDEVAFMSALSGG